MRRIAPMLFLSLLFTLSSCHKDTDDDVTQANITFDFSHSWDEIPVSQTDFNTIKFTNTNGDKLSIEKLRYLISKITFQNSKGEFFELDGYNLVDVTNDKNVSFTSTTKIPTGSYTKVWFTFGFDNDANYKNYTDLNSASWNVPEMLGGGYHFMQFEGKFIDNTTTEKGYAYHAIRAVNISSGTPVFKDTFFKVDLGPIIITNNTVFNIKMNIAEWFKNPNTWDLNILNNMLMPNFDAQGMMFQNGQNVFSLDSKTP